MIFKKIGKGIFKGFVRVLFFLSLVYFKARFFSRVIYTDKKAVKEITKKPCIFICNHTSHSDGLFVTRMTAKYKPYTYIARDWYEKKFAKPFFDALDYIPLDRKDLDTSWLDMGIEKINKGYSILIFPEGKTSKGAMNEFKPGFLYLAKRTDIPVIPMCVIGKYKTFRRQTLVIGEPIKMDLKEKGRPSLILKKYSDVCQGEVQKLLDTYTPEKLKTPEKQDEKKAA